MTICAIRLYKLLFHINAKCISKRTTEVYILRRKRCLQVCVLYNLYSRFRLSLLRCIFNKREHTHTHTRLTAPFPGLPRWASTRKVKPIWILLKQETVSGSGISWAICESASRSRQITMPVLHDAKFFAGRMPFLPPNQQRQSTEGKTTKGNNPQNFAPSLWGIRAPNTWFLRPTRKPKQQLNQLIHFSRAHGWVQEKHKQTDAAIRAKSVTLVASLHSVHAMWPKYTLLWKATK